MRITRGLPASQSSKHANPEPQRPCAPQPQDWQPLGRLHLRPVSCASLRTLPRHAWPAACKSSQQPGCVAHPLQVLLLLLLLFTGLAHLVRVAQLVPHIRVCHLARRDERRMLPWLGVQRAVTTASASLVWAARLEGNQASQAPTFALRGFTQPSWHHLAAAKSQNSSGFRPIPGKRRQPSQAPTFALSGFTQPRPPCLNLRGGACQPLCGCQQRHCVGASSERKSGSARTSPIQAPMARRHNAAACTAQRRLRQHRQHHCLHHFFSAQTSSSAALTVPECDPNSQLLTGRPSAPQASPLAPPGRRWPPAAASSCSTSHRSHLLPCPATRHEALSVE